MNNDNPVKKDVKYLLGFPIVETDTLFSRHTGSILLKHTIWAETPLVTLATAWNSLNSDQQTLR